MAALFVSWRGPRPSQPQPYNGWRRVRVALACCVLLFAASETRAERFEIVYPRLPNSDEARVPFATALLELAMHKARVEYTIRPSSEVMERPRAVRELAAGRSVNLLWTSMSARDEANLRPIRIPIHRGLIGYRVLLIRRDRQPEFDKIRSLEQLRAMTAGQGIGWVDVGILRRAGLHVETSTYASLFQMTQAGRIDYFPRSVLEAYPELAERRATEPDVVVERHLLLAYRSDFIFYTNKRDERLASTIESGLRAAVRDGSYMQLFHAHPYIRDALARAQIAGRTIIRIDNPCLSEPDRALGDRYWRHD